MIARKPLSHVLFSASLYLFVFLSIDREASMFGFDMRYVLIALMVPALFFSLCDVGRYQNTKVEAVDKLFFAYYALISISLLALIETDLPIDMAVLGNVTILHGTNLLMLILIVLNRKTISMDSIANAVCI